MDLWLRDDDFVNKIGATYELVAMKMKNDGLGCQDRSREQLRIRAAAASARNLHFVK